MAPKVILSNICSLSDGDVTLIYGVNHFMGHEEYFNLKFTPFTELLSILVKYIWQVQVFNQGL